LQRRAPNELGRFLTPQEAVTMVRAVAKAAVWRALKSAAGR
jgi:hypothetical protein